MDTSVTSATAGRAPDADAAGNRLSTARVALLAACCAASVANVYYAQPLLDSIARDFAIPHAEVGGVITATQLGCALALLFVVPLGDLLNRKRLLAAQLALLTAACIGVAASSSRVGLLAGMAGVGLLGTAMTQGLIACAAALAGDGERGRVVGAAQGGVVIGLLIARSVAGAVTDLAGWRAVYLASAAIAIVMGVVLSRLLPDARAPRERIGYAALLASMGFLLRRDRVLQVRGMLALLMFAAFSIFWSALVLPLSAPPHAMSHTAIGAFGLVGALGAAAAARAGRLADRGLGQATTGAALVLLVASWLPLAFTTSSIPLLIVGIVLLDIGGQAIHVVNQSMILGARPDAHARLVGCYMLFYSVGSGLGAIASTLVYARAGWAGVCVLGAAVSIAALAFWAATLKRAR
ncbi:MFS transporter [Burkholderia ubonensis]|uniref:MFS transporter n=1 Tax=Burkholderia ubonensis TaxID=101571 RepID=A0AB74DER1_9BURK|nr:MFS transporter [Burkholderia ubonensis]PAJ78892.1 MFS transporter [Burkholderia ubonensis]PAJ90030.1 MFS transporter [Burkholderia ubonensis]PAJ96341.1 MFS transporter [Burkholderia ubonensis]PAK02928.1 MFS transporter [Burkholderia ubonensis]PAK07566.1 MFS transporter [Burkholderia ubonensis]